VIDGRLPDFFRAQFPKEDSLELVLLSILSKCKDARHVSY
jgi:hypothetical protein